MKAFQSSANIFNDILDNQRINSKVVIGLDYSKNTGKKLIDSSKTHVFVNDEVLYVLKNAASSFFTKHVVKPIDEVSLLINEELLAEDENEKKRKYLSHLGNQLPLKILKLIKVLR